MVILARTLSQRTPSARLPRTFLLFAVVGLLTFVAAPGAAQEGPPGPGVLGPAVGIRVTPTDVRPQTLQADFDLTWYTRVGPYPTTVAGYPTAGFPALDYGDGSTVPSTTLVLASSGGGPGGSNVYRNLTSFTHTYPSPGVFTVTGASFCTACVRSQFVYFPTGTPAPNTFTGGVDYVPTIVVGNLAGTTVGSGTVGLIDFSVRYVYTYYLAVTNTTQVDLRSILEVPTATPWALALLGGLLLLSGLAVLRQA